MMWWKVKDGIESEVKYTAIGTPYRGYRQDQCVMDEMVSIKQPTLVNASVPHSIINSGSEERWVLSVVLSKDGQYVTWDQALAAFSSQVV